MSIQWIIFDVMGVIFEVGDDTSELLIPFIQKRNPDSAKELIYQIYLKASLGEITSPEFWQKLGFGKDYPEIEKNYLDTCLTVDSEFIPIAEQLAKQYSLGILSNDIGDWSKFLRRKFELDRLFNATIISGDVGYRKPDKKIYEILLDQIRTPASSCILIDDRLKNLQPAAELGFKTVRFIRETSNHPFSPDFEIKSFFQLPRIVKLIYLNDSKAEAEG
jgi:putative hydrolase of the HAD superfamily